MTRRVAFLIYPTFDLLDLTGPLEVFQWAERTLPGSYACHVVSLTGGAVMSTAGLAIDSEPASLLGMDTLIVVGGASASSIPDGGLVDFIRGASGLRRRGSVCTGAFLLAAAGSLDSRLATTHWQWASQMQARFPAVKVHGDRIFTSDKGVWTSAGITAGIDMSLAMVEEDLGGDVARSVARMLVVYYRRPGGQLQFSSLIEHEPDTDRIRRVLAFAREHLSEPLSVERLAEAANLSPRQFGRVFRASTGMTAAKAIEKLRAETARPRVENTRDTLDAIARDVGFIDAMRMRLSFIRIFGEPPQSLRRSARRVDAGEANT